MSTTNVLLFLLLLALLLQASQAQFISPNRTSLRVKTAHVNGNLGVTVAEFGMQFAEPLYFQFAAPCPAGRCPVERQQAAIDADPCTFMACDFTLKGADCGKARLPQCESICAAQREALCPPVQDWITLELGVETEPILVEFRSPGVNLRLNFDQPCKALVFQVAPLYGGDGVLIYDIDQYAPTTESCCQFVQQPQGINAICPSFLKCYHYGTYFLRLRNFVADDLITVRVFALDIEAGPQKTESLPDAPPIVFPDPDFPFHVPLQWSVPFIYTYPDTGAFVPVLLSTYYCGFVTLQVSLDDFDSRLPTEVTLTIVSTDPANPFPSSTTSDLLFIFQPFSKIHICQTDQSQPPARIFALVIRNAGPILGTPATVSITADYDREGLIAPIPPQKAGDLGSWSNYTAWPSVNLYAFASGALKIDCPGASFKCVPGCDRFGCCQQSWPAYPTSPSLQPLYPVPFPLAYLNEGILASDFSYLPHQLDAHVLGVVMLLEENLGGSITYGRLGPNWADILPQCTISSAFSSMGTLDGRWITGAYHPPLISQGVCDHAIFSTISDEMDAIFDLFIHDDPSDIGAKRPLSLRYRADLLTILDGWIDCQDFVQGQLLTVTQLNLTTDNTKICPVYSDDDPCCNPSLAWNECCVPRSLEFQLDLTSQVIDAFDDVCQLPQCSLPILQSYVQGSLTDTVGGCEPSVLESPSQVTTQAISAFAKCLKASFGNDFEGMACYSDSECPSNRCDIVAHVCLGDISALTQTFLGCLVETIPTPVRLSLIEIEGWSEAVKTTPLADLILDRFSEPYCIQRNHPVAGTFYRPHYESTTGFSACPPGHFQALTRSTNPQVWAGSRSTYGGNCAYELTALRPNVDQSTCETADMVCNDGSQDCVAGGFCGACETPATCAVVAVDEASCSSLGQVCILADGAVVTGLTASQCAQRFSCTGLCHGAACDSQAACLSQGTCVDQEDVYYLLDNTYWAGSHSRAGVCAFPQPPYADPDCNVVYPGSYPSSYGCLSFGRCEALGFVLNCQVDYDTQASCQAAGGTWYVRPTNQAQCENPILCDVPRYTGQRSAVGDSNFQYLSAFPSAENCADCGGTTRPINAWVPHQWLPGQLRPVSWIQRQRVPVYIFEPSLDFATLSILVLKASESTTAFQTLNALQCSYGNQKAQIKRLSCNCLDELDRSVCFQQDEVASIGQGRFCPFTTNRVVSPPFSLESTNASLLPSVQYQCIDFQINKIAAQIFDPPPVSSVTIAFKRRAQGTIQGSYSTVFNSKEALVGSVIGDAFQIVFSSKGDASAVSQVVLCETLPTYITPNTTLYPVYDFGTVDFSDNEIVVRPSHVPTNYHSANNQLCATLTLIGSLTNTYAPIVRFADDEAVAGVALTAGQKACLYVVASLFVLAAVVWLLLSGRVYLAEAHDFRHPSNVVWVCTIWIFVQRSTYLYLVAAGVLNQPSVNQLADYFMMDFPMCLYLIANFQIGLSFFFLHLKSNDDMRQFWSAFTVGAFLIIMLFIGVLLAYRFQVLDQPGLSGPILCPFYNDTTSTARIIRLIYQSIIIAVAFFIGVSEVILGTSLYKKTSEMIGSERILVLAVAASVGIMSDAVAFLIYYIVDEPHPYFSIVLLFTEILPLVFLLFHSHNTRLQRAEALSNSNSK